MAHRIESIKLERFRAFRALSVDGLGRVNLITGKNNTGKSSLLEGLRVVATDAAIETLRDILRYREEYSSTPDDGSSRQQPVLVSNLFHGFPDLSAKIEPLVLSANGKDYDTSVSVYVNWLSREPDKEGNLRFVEHSPDDPEGSASLVVSTSDAIRRYELDDLRDRRLSSVRGSSTSSSDCCFVGPYSGMRTTELGKLWDDIALTDDEGVVVDALRIIEPHVSKVTMVGGDGTRTAYRHRTHRSSPTSCSSSLVRRRHESFVQHSSQPGQFPRQDPAGRRVREWTASLRTVGCLAYHIPPCSRAQHTGIRYYPQLGHDRDIPKGRGRNPRHGCADTHDSQR